jgi:hypothetical protein
MVSSSSPTEYHIVKKQAKKCLCYIYTITHVGRQGHLNGLSPEPVIYLQWIRHFCILSKIIQCVHQDLS